MYRVIIYGCPDEFALKVHGKVFNRRGLLKFLSRHANKLADYEYVAIGHGRHANKLADYEYVAIGHFISLMGNLRSNRKTQASIDCYKRRSFFNDH